MNTEQDVLSATLPDVIKDHIMKNGAIPFSDFMEMALYYPGRGYYTSSQNRIGISGDYYTSPTITPLLGAMIGRQLEEMWGILEKKDFTIIEYGAGSCMLCQDILNYLKDNSKLFKTLTYYIVEKNSSVHEKKNEFLSEKVKWIDTTDAIDPINGCVLSNELLDNFPIHRVVMKDTLMEVYVGYEDGFVEFLQPASKELQDYFSKLQITLPKGFCTEVNLEALKWLKNISAALRKGFVLTIDYGYPSHELYRADKRLGTLICYDEHKINDNPYDNIGEQDITTHVNFSALHHWGLLYGLEHCGFVSQSYFLRALGLNEYLRNIEENPLQKYFDMQQKTFFLNTFMMDMGNKLKVLIQQKGIPAQKLSGLKFLLSKLY